MLRSYGRMVGLVSTDTLYLCYETKAPKSHLHSHFQQKDVYFWCTNIEQEYNSLCIHKRIYFGDMKRRVAMFERIEAESRD